MATHADAMRRVARLYGQKKELARMLGRTEAWLHNILRGEQHVGLEVIDRLVDAGINGNVFLGTGRVNYDEPLLRTGYTHTIFRTLIKKQHAEREAIKNGSANRGPWGAHHTPTGNTPARR